METVYRIQDKKGRGPWKPGFSHLWSVEKDDLDNLPPITMFLPSVPALCKSMRHGCGCVSVDDLRLWFTQEEYYNLLKLGHQSFSMSVDEIVFRTPNQCLFSSKRPLHEIGEPFDLYPLN